MASTHRLAAILAADVAGYSRLMGADEEGIHERLRAHLRQLIDPKINEHRGHIVKNTGDGVLVEFASVVDAVRCAAEIQRGMIDREPEVPHERRIRCRIGINLGDVIAEDDDIFGDGVNVAARLEALAEPGGICVSRTVHDNIRDKLPYAFEDIGEQSVKNIARPVRVYTLRPRAIVELPTSSVPSATPRRRRSVLPVIAAAIVAVLAVAVGVWWLWSTTKPSPTPAVAATTSIAQRFVAPRLSIVVLPFANLSDDREQQYFADGITEDLTTDLSRIQHSFVISRNTAFTYRNKPTDTRQIGRELGVRYVLEGSVRRSGHKIRVNAQLIDADTDAHLWADQFDGDMGDLFALQNEITSRIAIALNLELTRREAARPTDNPDALDQILRGRAASLKPPSRDKYKDAINLYERALTLDPQSVEAQSFLAYELTGRVLDEMTESSSADIARAEMLATQALAISPGSPIAHGDKAQVLRAQNRCNEAVPEYEMALAFNRNNVGALAGIGRCKIHIGPLEEAIPLLEQAIRLSPGDPGIGNLYFRIGEVHLLQSRTDKAILWLEKARSANAGLSFVHAWLASAYALKGETEHATAELAEARRVGGESSWSSIAKIRARTRDEAPTIRALSEATFFAGLREAGMPEE
jgi:adenylate cyclase